MKKLNITFLLIMLMSMVGFDASAHDFAVNNTDGKTIYYNVTNSKKAEVEVTYRGSAPTSYSNEYIGDVAIPQSVTYNKKTYKVTGIGYGAFQYCSGLTSVTIPNSVTGIGMDAFAFCLDLTSVIIPNSVITIGYGAFDNCCGITSISIPDNVTKIEGATFYNCSNLTSITIPQGVTSIGSSAFWNCYHMKSVTIPSSVTTIEGNAFDGCTGLNKVIISDIAAWCRINFANCYANPLYYANLYSDEYTMIKDLVIPDGVINLGKDVFYNWFALKSVIIPNSVTSIGYRAFAGCSYLTSVIIPKNVTSIGEGAFGYCEALTSATIPNSVKSIGSYAFGNCPKLTSIYSYIENPTSDTGSNFESSHYTNATLYVPQGTKEQYLATSGWKNFTHIEEMSDPSAINGINAEDAKSFVGKIIKDNKIIIMKNGKKHSVSGQGM